MIFGEYNYPQLILECRNGGSAGRDLLARKVRSDIGPYVYRMLFNRELAEDIIQDTLLKVFELIHTIRQPEKFRSWLYRTAWGQVQHYFRQQKKIEIDAGANPDDYASPNTVEGLTHLLETELAEAITRAMAGLKESYRHILVLRVYQGFSYEEIGQILSCSPLAAKVLFHRAKQALKKKLTGRGFNKSMLAPALLLFGKLSAQASGQAVVPVVTGRLLTVSPLITMAGSGVSYLAVATLIVLVALPWRAVSNHFSRLISGNLCETRVSCPIEFVAQGATADWLVRLNRQYTEQGFERLDYVIEAGEEVEFIFPGKLIDGTGADLFITELGPDGECVEVYAGDSLGHEHWIGQARTPKVDAGQKGVIFNYPITCRIDLANAPQDFEPDRIKLVNSANGKNNGFELQQIQARIAVVQGGDHEK